ncbi:MAG: YggS family pyridoxal phosphate-dependent enzyme [Candidatus Marinimicrobia bacterium]|nr:YggS family pyridoxal phosphate-dependent enzyme [Candidatus Neomarinimicrobiota bacterium]
MSLKKTLERIQSRIDYAQKRGGFDHPVQLVAVTKTHPFSTIEDCYKIGITSIGENRIQESSQKFRSLDLMPNLKKRFIGKLQSNKVNKCLDMFDTIDSVDSFKLARRINARAEYLGKKIPVLLEINTSGETQKHGFTMEKMDEMLCCIDESNLIVTGLMTLGPRTADKEKIRDSFIQLRKLKDSINRALNQPNLIDLSMGMSGDYEIGVEEGSTMVRIGTALLGPRKK